MSKIRKYGLCLVVALGFGVFAPASQALVIYDLSAACNTGCTGTATGVLTLADTYVPGTAIAAADFVSWSYSSTSGNFSSPPDATLLLVTGTLPNGSSADVSFNMLFNPAATFSTSTASWLGFSSTAPLTDTGQEYLWTLRSPVSPVPIPALAPLLAMLLGLFGLVGWRRRRQSAGTAAPAAS